MNTVHISVTNKVALYSARDGAIVCGNDDYQIQFALDSEWDGLPAKARFVWGGKYEDAPIVDGIAQVPVIVRAHEVKVGVYSEDGSLQTTTAARVPCDRSILCDTAEPTEGNEAHYASEAQKAADRAEAAADRAEAAGGSGGGSTGGGVVIDPESVNQAQEAAQRAEAAQEAAIDSAQAAGQSAEEAETSKNQATAAKTAAEAAQRAAEAAKAEAAQKATEAINAAQEAVTAQSGAREAAAAAEGSAGQAETSATDAEAAKKAAQAAKNTAEQKATEAGESAAGSTASAKAAEAAKTGAEAAQEAAETASTEAGQKAAEAETAAQEATTAQSGAQEAAAAAETAKSGAESAKNTAEQKATQAANAAQEAVTAATEATEAKAAAEVAAEVAVAATTSLIEPAETDLPRIFFTGAFPKSKLDADESLEMTYISKTARFSAYATAKVQGSSSTTFAKKNFTFKLFEDAAHENKKKVAFRNWPAKNKFVAKANTIDRTHARNVVSARIWGDVVKSRAGYASLPAELRNSPNQGAIDGFPVQIYLNGVYQGLYTWNIPKDDWMAGMSSDLVDQHAIICAEGGSNADTGQDGPKQITFNEAYPSTTQVINGYDWEDETKTVGANIRANFKAFSDLVVSGSDSAFKSNLHTYMDLESLIDTFIYIWLACGIDSLGKNQFMYTYNAGLPWYSGVYDLDSTWGLNPEGTSLKPYNTVMQDDYLYPANKGLYNKLYERLWKLYPNEVRNRWNELKNGALSLANIINHFEAFHDAIPADLFAEDSAETTAGGQFVTTGAYKGFDKVLGVDKNNIQQIRNFAAARWAYVDSQINLIKCEGITLSASTLALTKDKAVGTLTATLTPANCTEAVVWSSDNEEVAAVSGGTVTAIYNGTCTITATCGDYSATCTVTVSGFVAPGSENLADPSSPDWKKGYYFNGSTETEADKPWRTITNYIEFRPGDVFTIERCQALYSKGGTAYYALYDENKSYKTSLNVNQMQTAGEVTVTNKVTTIKITASRLATISPAFTADRGYIRFQLGIFDGQSDIDTDNIVIKRNPNGENAEAWA